MQKWVQWHSFIFIYRFYFRLLSIQTDMHWWKLFCYHSPTINRKVYIKLNLFHISIIFSHRADWFCGAKTSFCKKQNNKIEHAADAKYFCCFGKINLVNHIRKDTICVIIGFNLFYSLYALCYLYNLVNITKPSSTMYPWFMIYKISVY